MAVTKEEAAKAAHGAPVVFWGRRETHREFSNFWPSPFIAYRLFLAGQAPVLPRYPSVEHFFQSEKFRRTDAIHAAAIREARTANDARKLGQSRTAPIRQDWDTVKESVMWVGLWHKFTQHPDLGCALLATGTRPLIEGSPYDAYWGWGPHRDGQNRLGVLLERLRKRLNEPERWVRLIIAGSRNFTNVDTFKRGISTWLDETGAWPDEVICGDAPGADSLGERWARGCFVPVRHYPAAWGNLNVPGAVVRRRGDGSRYNAKAGLDRNLAMARAGTHLLAFWDGHSRGTGHMVGTAQRGGLQVTHIPI